MTREEMVSKVVYLGVPKRDELAAICICYNWCNHIKVLETSVVKALIVFQHMDCVSSNGLDCKGP